MEYRLLDIWSIIFPLPFPCARGNVINIRCHWVPAREAARYMLGSSSSCKPSCHSQCVHCKLSALISLMVSLCRLSMVRGRNESSGTLIWSLWWGSNGVFWDRHLSLSSQPPQHTHTDFFLCIHYLSPALFLLFSSSPPLLSMSTLPHVSWKEATPLCTELAGLFAY